MEREPQFPTPTPDTGAEEEKQKEMPETEPSAKERIDAVETWDELYEALDAIGPLQGSKKEYTPEDLKEKIDNARKAVILLEYITNTAGLRDKVRMMIENEGPVSQSSEEAA